MDSKMLVVCSTVLVSFSALVSTAVIGHNSTDPSVPFRHPACFISGHLSLQPWETYNQRCMKCSCNPHKGLICEEPVCDIRYLPYQEESCLQWSADGCCCERQGCLVNGEEYMVDQWYKEPVRNSDCWECQCKLNADYHECRAKICPALVCVDPRVRDGECCARCFMGPNCNYPELPGVDPANPILGVPLQLMRSATIYADSFPIYYDCICVIPGARARCKGFPVRDAPL